MAGKKNERAAQTVAPEKDAAVATATEGTTELPVNAPAQEGDDKPDVVGVFLQGVGASLRGRGATVREAGQDRPLGPGDLLKVAVTDMLVVAVTVDGQKYVLSKEEINEAQ